MHRWDPLSLLRMHWCKPTWLSAACQGISHCTPSLPHMAPSHSLNCIVVESHFRLHYICTQTTSVSSLVADKTGAGPGGSTVI